MCAMAPGTTLISRRWTIKESDVKESDGDEAFNSIEMVKRCMKENG